MELLRSMRDRLGRLTPQRRAAEIAVAVLLTAAAMIFIAAALMGSPSDPGEPFATARKPATD